MKKKVSFGWIILLSVLIYEQPLAADDFSIQNAVLEGIQISTERGEKPDEKVVTVYFIFIDKPSSYFFETKRKPNRLIFEFHDTKKGAAPISPLSEPPILGFEIEETRVDVNKEVKGLTPEWHDVVKVKFNLEHIPNIVVADEYNVVSFRYKWTTEPAKIKKYAQKENTKPVIIWTLVGLAALGGGVYALLPPQPQQPEAPLDISDLPKRNDPLIP